MSDAKEIIVVGGPNGAGKTTLARQLVVAKGYRYLGADEIAERLFPDNPSGHRVEAGREFLIELTSRISQGESLIVESTLSGRSLVRHVQSAKLLGFKITMAFTYLDAADTCVVRVKERVRKGGHDVPEADIRRRFPRSLRNFWNLYRPLAYQWTLLFNTGDVFQEVAAGTSGTQVISDELRLQAFLSTSRASYETD